MVELEPAFDVERLLGGQAVEVIHAVGEGHRVGFRGLRIYLPVADPRDVLDVPELPALLFDFLHPLDALGHVSKLREDGDDRPVRIGDGPIVPLAGDDLAVLADVLVQAVIAALVLQQVRHGLSHLVQIGVDHERLPRFAR
jgi:hypothetical protein